MRFQIKRAVDVFRVIEGGRQIRKLTKSRGGFRKKLMAQLEERGGEYKLFLWLSQVSDYAEILEQTPVSVELEGGAA